MIHRVSAPARVDAPPVPPGRPRFWLLVLGTFWGQVLGTLAVLACALPLLLLVEIPLVRDGFFWPWTVGDAWSLLANVAWSVVLVVPVAALVRIGVTHRAPAPALGWIVVAVAAGGYLTYAATENGGGRLVIAILATAALVRGLAYETSGAVRPWPLPLRTRWLVAAVAGALLVGVVPYGLLHPFRALNGGGGPSGSSTDARGHQVYDVKPGHTVVATSDIGLGGGPVRVESIEPIGASRTLQVRDITVGFAWPERGRSLPTNMRDETQQLNLRLAVPGCQPGGAITAVRLHYRLHGLALAQTVRLSPPVAARCRS
jgi:hypothetical protein